MSSDVSLLPPADQAYLSEKGLAVEVARAAGGLEVIFRRYEFPSSYTPRNADLMIRLPAGYPNANPDMFWTDPPVRLLNGTYPNRADVFDATARGWQRWSRHGTWRAGIDDIRSKMAAVRIELETGK